MLRAGGGEGNSRPYTSFIAEKWSIELRNTVVFTTFPREAPADSSTARRFATAWAVCSATPPSTRLPSGRNATWPLQKSKRPAAETAWLYGPTAPGAPAVECAFRSMPSLYLCACHDRRVSTRTLGMPEGLHAYLLRETVQENPLQRRLREETRARYDSEMQIAPEQGQFFRVLVRSLGVRRALEVGTFTGYSALAVALELPEDGTIDCCDVSEEFTAMARQFWDEAGVGHKVRLHIGPGAETLARLPQGAYDFAFIDADKAGYPAYFELCLRLLRPGGVACFDNTLWSGKVAEPAEQDEDTQAIRELNRIAATDPRVLSCLVPIGDGLTLCWLRPA